MDVGSRGSSDIWIWRARRNSSSRRRFSAAWCSRPSISAVIALNDSASSPNWSSDATLTRHVKSRRRIRPAPTDRSWIAPVIARARAKPWKLAASRMTRNSAPSTPSSISKGFRTLGSPVPAPVPKNGSRKAAAGTRMVNWLPARAAPVAQSTGSRDTTPASPSARRDGSSASSASAPSGSAGRGAGPGRAASSASAPSGSRSTPAAVSIRSCTAASRGTSTTTAPTRGRCTCATARIASRRRGPTATSPANSFPRNHSGSRSGGGPPLHGPTAAAAPPAAGPITSADTPG